MISIIVTEKVYRSINLTKDAAIELLDETGNYELEALKSSTEKEITELIREELADCGIVEDEIIDQSGEIDSSIEFDVTYEEKK